MQPISHRSSLPILPPYEYSDGPPPYSPSPISSNITNLTHEDPPSYPELPPYSESALQQPPPPYFYSEWQRTNSVSLPSITANNIRLAEHAPTPRVHRGLELVREVISKEALCLSIACVIGCTTIGAILSVSKNLSNIADSSHSIDKFTENMFSSAVIGGIAGAGAGITLGFLLNYLVWFREIHQTLLARRS